MPVTLQYIDNILLILLYKHYSFPLSTSSSAFSLFQVIKQRMQTSVEGYRTLPLAIRQVFAKEGVRGFYAGFNITLLREVNCIQYTV